MLQQWIKLNLDLIKINDMISITIARKWQGFSVRSLIIQIETKFANFVYSPYFTIFRNQTWQFH